MSRMKLTLTSARLYVRYIYRFLVDMMNLPELVRNIAIVGHLHHGKTSFVDMLVNETHSSVAWDVDKQVGPMFVFYSISSFHKG